MKNASFKSLCYGKILFISKFLFDLCLCYFAIFAVNNAGVSLLTILDCVPMELAKETFDINFFGTLRLINAVLPSMKARESGHIINNSSVFGVIGAPFFEVYCASKFAVEEIGRASCRERV